jgi:hypothetical protein
MQMIDSQMLGAVSLEESDECLVLHNVWELSGLAASPWAGTRAGAEGITGAGVSDGALLGQAA